MTLWTREKGALDCSTVAPALKTLDMDILLSVSNFVSVEDRSWTRRTLMDPLQRHGRIRRPSSFSTSGPSKQILHCFSCSAMDVWTNRSGASSVSDSANNANVTRLFPPMTDGNLQLVGAVAGMGSGASVSVSVSATDASSRSDKSKLFVPPNRLWLIVLGCSWAWVHDSLVSCNDLCAYNRP